MASTFTTRLNLEKPGTGEQDGTWGGTLNDNFDDLDVAIAGYLSKSVAGASDVTLSAAEYLNATIECTGTLTGNINVIVPATERTYDFINSTSGSFTLTVKTSGGTGTQVPQGGAARLVCDGTNVDKVLSSADTGLSDIVDDSTPQLGGPLDTNDNAVNYSEGSSVASGSSTDIWASDGNTVHVTGTTTITDLGTAPRVGAMRNVIFDGALTLTHSSSLILPGGANITTAAGDCAIFYADTTSVIRCLCYTKADGAAVVEPSAVSATVPVGMIAFYGGTSAPDGWLFCYGQAISRTTYSDLYALYSTTYGNGDGSTTFNLPDLRGRVIAGKDNMGGSSANRLTDAVSESLDGDTLGDTGGEETHTLTGGESGTSAHGHGTSGLTTNSAGSHSHGGGLSSGSSAFGSSGSLGSGSTSSAGSHSHSVSGSIDNSSEASADDPHNNVQPTIILNAFVYTGVTS